MIRLIPLALLVLVVGCSGRTELIPNDNPALRKTPPEFAADAAKRHPYNADAPRGGQAKAQAEVEYLWDRIRLINLSDTEWTNVEIWINGQYVVHLPKLPSKQLQSIPFQALYNDKGQYVPTSNGKVLDRQPVRVEKVELYRDGKLYDVPVTPAE